MIDKAVFIRELTLLMQRFGRTLPDPIIARYREYLNDRLSTAQFEAAARVIFNNDGFWPAPARFLEAVGVDSASEAEAAWELALSEAHQGVARPLDAYDPAHAAALRIVGKNQRIGATKDDQLPFLKREFVSAFKAYRERGSLPELNKPAPVELPNIANLIRRPA